MTDLPFIFVGGLLGSAHCVGMCGPLAIALGLSGHGLGANMRRQLAFSAGRVSTYGFIGAVAAFAGLWFRQWSWMAIGVQGVLAVIGGSALIVLGLTTAGVLPQFHFSRIAPQSCAAAAQMKTLLTSPKLIGAFLAGVFTGFIPCGLVYAFLAIAASSENVLRGWIVMVTFGAGTVPLLLATGSSGSIMSLATRARVLKFAAWCIVVTGVISIARGAGHLSLSPTSSTGGCPFCHQTETSAPIR